MRKCADAKFKALFPFVHLRLRLRGRPAEVHRQLHFFYVLYLSVDGLEALNIFSERFHEAFGVLGSKDDAGFDFAFGSARHHIHEVNDELCMAMGNDGQVGVRTFCYFLRYLDVELTVVILILFVHVT